jgi:PAS domain S-box-containing protein
MPVQRLRAVFHAMSEGLVIHGPDGRVVEANAAAAPMLGLSHDELLGRSPVDPRWQAVRADGSPWPGDEHPAMQALKSGQPLRDQVMGVDAPGRGRCWLHVNASPFDDGGGHSGVVATFSDITAQRSLEARLAQSAAELADLYDHAPCGYHTLDVHGRYLRINATELAWLGCTRDELLGRLGPQDFFTDAGRATFRDNFPRLLASGHVEGVELDLLSRDGSLRHVSVSATAIRDEAGRFVASRSVMHDITELHRARSALQRLIVDQAAVLDNDLVGIARIRERRFVWVNPGMARLFGHTPDELVGQSTRVLYHSDEDWLAQAQAFPASASAGQPKRVQSRLRHKDGHPVWTDISARRLAPGSSEVLAVLADVSPLKQADAVRQQSARLEAENREIRELLQERSDMLDVLAHEVRQPLNNASAALQSAGAALAQAGDSQAAQGLQRARTVMTQVLANIDNTLAVAALLARADTVRREDTDVDLLLGLAVGDMPAGQAGRIRIERATATRTAALDVGLMRLALRNLLANALRYAEGPVVLRVADSDEPLALVLEVIDSGPGIAAELMPRLFERGTRGRHGPEQAGHGLGLYIVQRVMDLHGGQVQALRREGAGMTMRLLVVQSEDRE